MTHLYLSHILEEDTPLYGDNGQIKIKRTRSIVKGDTSNNSSIEFPAHSGTHVDAPYHFYENGEYLESFSPEYWQVNNSYLIDYPCELGQLVTLEEIKTKLNNIPMECELLLLKTGIEVWRKKNPDDYMKKGPGIAADVALWLRQNRNLKFFGIDFISISSFLHREVGREAHKIFLSSDIRGSSPIILVEDMVLSKLKRNPKHVIIMPIRFLMSDGAPVTITANI